MRRARVASISVATVLALAAAALVTPAAVAVETWLPATYLSDADVDSYNPVVEVDAAGNATAVWVSKSGTTYVVRASSRPAAGAWSAAVALSGDVGAAVAPQLAANDRGDLVAVWESGPSTTSRIQASVRGASGGWSAAETLSEAGQGASSPSVTIDRTGRATVLWVRSDGTNRRVQASSRGANGAWSTPTTLSEAGNAARQPSVGVDGTGRLTAVWGRSDGANYRVQSSTRAPDGDWTVASTISDAGQSASAPTVAVADDGTATALWIRSDGASPRIQATSRPQGSGWSIPVNISDPDQNVFGGPAAAVDAAGVVTVAWSQLVGANYRIQVSIRRPDGLWTPGTAISVAGQNGLYPAVASRGAHTVVTWLLSGTDQSQAQASTRTGDGSWRAPVRLSSGTPTISAAGVDPAGNAVVTWGDKDDGAPSYRIRASALDVSGPVITGFTAPATATVGQPTSLSLTAYDVWSAVAGTTWSFGDGTTASGASVSHTWTAPGTYTVTATVTDAVGNTTTRSSTATVTAAQVAAPTLGKLKLRPGTIHLIGPKKDRKAKVTVTVTTASKLTLTFKKKGVKKPLRLTKNLRAGRNTFTLTAKIGKKKRLTVGTWKVTAVAANAAGSSTAKKLTLKVVR
ncbi:PKD domain-containing protein [Nocardioides exalbidus]|uniref:PKD domain-containing protein n=1 Tax=Nocardioides exalbidus TaxID=402596 RepID=A0A1H4JXS2_9ACTN|nr:PKD domain-containing protein [Nocardioides exalbidus]SEB50645.1 PKD domain-containing protein [Nocardioides exalbidus]